jgi:hypothetical protein
MDFFQGCAGAYARANKIDEQMPKVEQINYIKKNCLKFFDQEHRGDPMGLYARVLEHMLENFLLEQMPKPCLYPIIR